jgi:hypothetical protein
MKKTLVVLLILAVAGGVFAQDITWSGGVRTGIAFDKSSEEGAANTYGLTDSPPDPGAAGLTATQTDDDTGKAVQVNLGVKVDFDNYGMAFKFNTALGNGANVPTISYGYVWANFFDGLFDISAGQIDGAKWASVGDQGFEYDSGWGIRFNVAPIEGLNLGVRFDLTGTTALGADTFGWVDADENPATADVWDDIDGANSTVANKYELKDFFLETAIGAKYSADLFDVALGLKLDSLADNGTETDGDFYWGKDAEIKEFFSDKTDKGFKAYLGFAYKGLEALTAKAEVEFANFGAFSGDPSDPEEEPADGFAPGYTKYKGMGSIFTNQVIGYQINDAFSVKLVIYEDFLLGKFDYPAGTSDEDKKEGDASLAPYFKFVPSVTYKLNDKLTLGLEGAIALKPDYIARDFYVKPSVSFAFGEHATISGYYKLASVGYTKYVDADTNGDALDPITTHRVQAVFDWSF